MKVLILEACRSPEIIKGNTEASVLSKDFARDGIPFEIYSNDGIWESCVEISRSLLSELLRNPVVSIVHLAVHGGEEGLVLRWSKDAAIRDRMPPEILTPSDIRSMREWNEKMVVSGACSSASLAPDFLAAGATAVVAPAIEVPWSRIGLFFRSFYLVYRRSAEPEGALAEAVLQYPEYRSYRVFRGEGKVAAAETNA